MITFRRAMLPLMLPLMLLLTLPMAMVGTLSADEVLPVGIGVDEHLGQQLPAPIILEDERGRSVPLIRTPSDGRPILLVPAYYRCPQLCGLVLEAALHAAKAIDWSPARDYRLVTISFDSADHPAQALQKQAGVLAQAGADTRFSEATWPFMSATDSTIEPLLRALGERIERQADGTIAHPAVAIVLTPDGIISRYLYGIAMRPFDLKLALLEASRGGSGPSLDRVLLYCYRYDPSTRRYGLFITRFLQIGGVAFAVIAALVLTLLVRRIRRTQGRPAHE